MSILQEYEELRKELGDKVIKLIEKYCGENPGVFFSDVIYNEENYNKFNEWKEIKNIENTTEKVLEKTKLILEKEKYNDFEIEYVLVDKTDSNKSFAIISNIDEIAMIVLDKNEIYTLPEWDYNADNYFFDEMGNRTIGYMSLESHYGMWCSINETYPLDLENKEGLQIYLKYCKDNNINMNILKEKFNYSGMDLLKFQHDKEIYYKDNISLIAVGSRKDTPVALLLKESTKSILESQYIIAFNYSVKDEKMQWGYGYYYDKDFKKAMSDFENVIKGKNLANTFSKNSKEKER